MTKAVGACKGGFTAKGDKASTAYESVTSEPTGSTGDAGSTETTGTPAPTPGADESLVFRATTDYKGDTHTARTQATHRGAVHRRLLRDGRRRVHPVTRRERQDFPGSGQVRGDKAQLGTNPARDRDFARSGSLCVTTR